MDRLVITPNPNCRACNGTGIVTDWVLWGMGTTAIETTCDCVIEQLPEDCDDFDIIGNNIYYQEFDEFTDADPGL